MKNQLSSHLSLSLYDILLIYLFIFFHLHEVVPFNLAYIITFTSISSECQIEYSFIYYVHLDYLNKSSCIRRLHYSFYLLFFIFALQDHLMHSFLLCFIIYEQSSLSYSIILMCLFYSCTYCIHSSVLLFFYGDLFLFYFYISMFI
jgi:hypothetical protein